MAYTGIIDGPRQMRQYLGIANNYDIQNGDNPALNLSKSSVISGSGATVTLTAQQSGATALFDRAAGIVYTLPAPAVGLNYRFIVSTTITSNAAKVITDSGTTLLIGNILVCKDSDGTSLATFGNGSTHVSVSMNGTTTGGIIGTELIFTCVNSTTWQVSGFAHGSGTIATPFATS